MNTAYLDANNGIAYKMIRDSLSQIMIIRLVMQVRRFGVWGMGNRENNFEFICKNQLAQIY